MPNPEASEFRKAFKERYGKTPRESLSSLQTLILHAYQAGWNARGAADARIADKQILRHTDGSAAIDEGSSVAMEIIEDIQNLDEKEQG